MAWAIEFTPRARRALARLDQRASQRILDFLFERVAKADDPLILAKTLKGPEHENMLRFRVGDYRILTRIDRNVLTVFVIEVGHRREIYR